MGMAKPWRKRVRGPGQNHVHPSTGAGAPLEGRFRLWQDGGRSPPTAAADPTGPIGKAAAKAIEMLGVTPTVKVETNPPK